jgi:hypothetical protein
VKVKPKKGSAAQTATDNTDAYLDTNPLTGKSCWCLNRRIGEVQASTFQSLWFQTIEKIWERYLKSFWLSLPVFEWWDAVKLDLIRHLILAECVVVHHADFVWGKQAVINNGRRILRGIEVGGIDVTGALAQVITNGLSFRILIESVGLGWCVMNDMWVDIATGKGFLTEAVGDLAVVLGYIVDQDLRAQGELKEVVDRKICGFLSVCWLVGELALDVVIDSGHSSSRDLL